MQKLKTSNISYAMVLVFIGLMFSLSKATAATVEVIWDEPDSFRDIHPGGNSRLEFREETFTELEENFAQLAGSLPADQILQIKVRDLDLAGYVNVNRSKRKRFISAKYFPRIKFTYKLVNTEGGVVKAGGVNLKKPDFVETTLADYTEMSLGYEKFMIDEWFKFTFTPREPKE